MSAIDDLFEEFVPERVPVSDVWKTKDGREILVRDMDDKHLLNTIRMLAAKHSQLALTGPPEDEKWSLKQHKRHLSMLHDKLKMLIKEAKRRKIHEWLKFGLSGTALEIINDAGD